jgi:hypothetical protein
MKYRSSAAILAALALGGTACTAGPAPTPIVIYVTPGPSTSQSTAGSSASDVPAASAPAQRTAVTVSGKGIMNSKLFSLGPGDYLVGWKATPSSSGGCYHGASLVGRDNDDRENLGNELLDSKTPATGETNLYGLTGGRYYIDASSGCSWTYTFTPQ